MESKLLYKAVLKPIWHSDMGGSRQFQHQNLPALSIQGSPIHSEYSLVINNHRIHEDLQINTVLSEIKKWNTNYFNKIRKTTLMN
jgi:hypothetical protein